MTGPVRLVALYVDGSYKAADLLDVLWDGTWSWRPPVAAVEALGLVEAVQDWRAALVVHALDALTTLDDALSIAGPVGCHRDRPARVCLVCLDVVGARTIAIATCARALVEDVPKRAAAGLCVG